MGGGLVGCGALSGGPIKKHINNKITNTSYLKCLKTALFDNCYYSQLKQSYFEASYFPLECQHV